MKDNDYLGRRAKFVRNRYRKLNHGKKIAFSSRHVGRLYSIYDCCVYCGEKKEKLAIDHVIPVSQGGKTDLSNMVLACEPCNHEKAGRTLGEWKPEILETVLQKIKEKHKPLWWYSIPELR